MWHVSYILMEPVGQILTFLLCTDVMVLQGCGKQVRIWPSVMGSRCLRHLQYSWGWGGLLAADPVAVHEVQHTAKPQEGH